MTMTDPGPEPQTIDTHEGFRPIADYGLLADCNSAALVDRAGSIGWLCPPRSDSPAGVARVFDPHGGHWWSKPPRRALSHRAPLRARDAGAGDDVRDRDRKREAGRCTGVRPGSASP